MTETDRKFQTTDANLITCDQPCQEEFAVAVEGSKIKELGGQTQTKRCVANGAPLRGQHFGGVSHANPAACRVCTIYTTRVDNTQTQ